MGDTQTWMRLFISATASLSFSLGGRLACATLADDMQIFVRSAAGAETAYEIGLTTLVMMRVRSKDCSCWWGDSLSGGQ